VTEATVAVLDETEQQADVAKARHVLGRVKMPAEIVGFNVRPGEDHYGDPALWIELEMPVEGSGLPERGRMREIVAFINETHAALRAANVRSWPFIKLVEQLR
jgi:hypothetical protein